MNRNIWLAYFLTAMKNSWFWIGIWVFYYLRFTDYAGIGLIETVMIGTITVGEIPTGAVADLLGKKKTLILAFFFEAIGGFIMAFAQDFNQLLLSVFIMCIGGAMYSGTVDALVFDSLKQEKREAKFDKIIANISSIALISMATASILGGLMYSVNPRLPFVGNAIGYSLGLVVSLFLIEPRIDTVKFSWKNYWIQTRQGFSQLFQVSARSMTVRLLLLGGFLVVLTEVLDSILLVELGFSEKQMGVIFALIFLIASASSQLSPWLKRKFGYIGSLNFLSLMTVAMLLIMPSITMFAGGLAILLIENALPIFNNLSSELINKQTVSRYRATTISTFNLLKNMPYVISAYFIGYLMDFLSAKMFAFYFGLILVAVILGVKLIHEPKVKSTS